MTKGDQFILDDGSRVEVKRVAADHSWADVKVTRPDGISWIKRQPLNGGRLPYDGAMDLSLWEDDGMPDYDTWAIIVNELDMVLAELYQWRDTCKREAWIYEKVAKHENSEKNLVMARYFWRRTDTLSRYIKRMEKELDD